MSIHRLLGIHVSVPEPGGLSAFYGELGLAGDAGTGFTGTDGGASVTVDDGPFRRLDSVSLGCHDEADLATMATRLVDGGRPQW